MLEYNVESDPSALGGGVVNPFVSKLRKLADLTACDVAVLEMLIAHPRQYGPKKILVREGDELDAVMVVLEGWLCRYTLLPSGSRRIAAFLLPGDACDFHHGLPAVTAHNIQAITSARAVFVAGDEMRTLMKEHPRIAQAIYRARLVGEGALRAWIVSIGRRSTIERVAHWTCELYLRALATDQPLGTGVSLPLSQQVLADSLGVTSVHVNRVLKGLRSSGAIAVDRGTLTVVEPVALAMAAGFDKNYLLRRRRQVV